MAEENRPINETTSTAIDAASPGTHSDVFNEFETTMYGVSIHNSNETENTDIPTSPSSVSSLKEIDTATRDYNDHSYLPSSTDESYTNSPAENNAVYSDTGLISKAMYNRYKEVVWVGLTPVITIFGISGNILGLWFVLCGKQRQPFQLFLFALMAVDLVYLIVVLLSNFIVLLERYDQALAAYLNCHAYATLHAIQSMTYSTCAHLITTMSLERLAILMLPLKLQSFCLHKYPVVVILVLFALNIALGVPGFLIRESKDIIDPKTNLVRCVSLPTAWANNPLSKVFVVVILTTARFVPGAITAIASLLIAIFLARRRANRAAMVSNKTTRAEQHEQLKITLTLMILSISLLLSLIPSAMATLMRKYNPELYGEGGPEVYTYLFVRDLGYFLRVLSSANDFFIYVLMSKPSRDTLKDMIKTKCCFCKITLFVTGNGISATENESLP